MAKKKKVNQDFNGIFKFNEADHIAGFYRGTVTLKHGRLLLLSTMSGDKCLAVPEYSTILGLPEDLNKKDFVVLKYKGTGKSENTGLEYMNIQPEVFELEGTEEAKEWDKKYCNVSDLSDKVPDRTLEQSETEEKEDDVPF